MVQFFQALHFQNLEGLYHFYFLPKSLNNIRIVILIKMVRTVLFYFSEFVTDIHTFISKIYIMLSAVLHKWNNFHLPDRQSCISVQEE